MSSNVSEPPSKRQCLGDGKDKGEDLMDSAALEAAREQLVSARSSGDIAALHRELKKLETCVPLLAGLASSGIGRLLGELQKEPAVADVAGRVVARWKALAVAQGAQTGSANSKAPREKTLTLQRCKKRKTTILKKNCRHTRRIIAIPWCTEFSVHLVETQLVPLLFQLLWRLRGNCLCGLSVTHCATSCWRCRAPSRTRKTAACAAACCPAACPRACSSRCARGTCCRRPCSEGARLFVISTCAKLSRTTRRALRLCCGRCTLVAESIVQ
eukprot:TRINITY_DN7842_c1_g1_i2.p1 TRINITY_DN7842_c1_g1~~TRINITY_DN7842_c1_g1_i2.p1  ORF type:complete len:289 (-),score=34.86 TRINITY_DN7842_c1_g1_i2:115-927(-)